MRFEHVLWRIAVGCAALLLLAPLTPRTSWVYLAASESRGSAANATHSAGWDWVVPLFGIVAIVALIAGRMQHPSFTGALLGAAVGALGLAVAGAAALGHWLDLRSGALADARWAIHPAPAVGYFAGIATVGMVAALALLGHWVRCRNPHPQG